MIDKAIKDAKKDTVYELEPTIDKDTQGMPGAPNITQAILEKIKACDAFVADVSIVTGDKKQEKRLSPNPNVLLELGYAIALLGWEKIILFCNEAYGTDEDLPFDIRQHRRIGYSLLQDDVKTEARNTLATHFKSRLIELLETGKSPSQAKHPYISVMWNSLNVMESEDPDGTDSDVITLIKAHDIATIVAEVETEIRAVKGMDGSIDPEWDKKLSKYIDQADKFLVDIQDKQKRNDFLLNLHATQVIPVTLSVENDGNATATDLRVEVELPDWLVTSEKFPSGKDVPKRPTVPKPIAPILPSRASLLGKATAIGHLNSLPMMDHLWAKSLNKRTSASYLRKDQIYFWADRLLHKHTITNTDDRIYLMASSDAPKGKSTLKGRAFCSEFEDWQDIELVVEIA